MIYGREYDWHERWFMWKAHQMNTFYSILWKVYDKFGWTNAANKAFDKSIDWWERGWECSQGMQEDKMSTSIEECTPYRCIDCGGLVNPMTDICTECGLDNYEAERALSTGECPPDCCICPDREDCLG